MDLIEQNRNKIQADDSPNNALEIAETEESSRIPKESQETQFRVISDKADTINRIGKLVSADSFETADNTSVHNEIDVKNSSLENSDQKLNAIKSISSKKGVKNNYKSLRMKAYRLKQRLVSKKYFMLMTIFLSVVIGISVGFGLRPANVSAQAKTYIGFPGEMFLRSLQFIALPLYFFKLVCGIIDLKKVSSNRKRIAFQIILFYLASLISSLLIALMLVLTIKPGSRINNLNLTQSNPFSNQILTTSDTILDTIR